MIAHSSQLLVAVAGAFVERFESMGPADHTAFGRALRMRIGHADEGPWDAALVHYWGYWSQLDHRTGRSSWPVGAEASAAELALYGASMRVLRDEPRDGDVFLQYSPVRRGFVHTGVVGAVLCRDWWSTTTSYYDVITMEGDMNERGELRGGKIIKAVRRLAAANGDQFLRWTELPDVNAGVRTGEDVTVPRVQLPQVQFPHMRRVV